MSIFKQNKSNSILGKKKSVSKKQESNNLLNTAAKVTIGAVTGAIAGLLFAPKSGKETRKKITEDASNLGEKVTDKSKELTQTTKEQVNNLKDKVKS